MRRFGVALMVFAAAAAMPAPAQAVGFSLLSVADTARISAWLPAGFTYTFTQIFDKVHGDGQEVVAFHTAVDGLGAGPGEVGTISLLRVQDIAAYRACRITVPPECGPGSPQPGIAIGEPIRDYNHGVPYAEFDADGNTISITEAVFEKIGGYNPSPWNSSGAAGVGAGAFIFNLSHVGPYLDQEGDPRVDFQAQNGPGQSFNDPALGPSFGFDIHNGGDLEVADAYLYHDWYGAGADGDRNSCIYGRCYDVYHRISDMEVFTVTATRIPPPEIPEPASLLLMGTGLLGMVAMYRKRSKTAVKASL